MLNKNNKQEALETIYNRTYKKAYVIAKQILKNEEDVLDVLQEVYISVFNHIDTLEDESKLDKWVNMIVANKCKDWLRKKKVILFSDMGEEAEDDYETTIEDDNLEFLPEASVDYAETKRLMAEILDVLPEDQRMCILMYYYDELSVNEIAESLDCSTGTVKSRLNYARKKIKEEVEALEKKGTKLYGIAPLPFIIWMLKGVETSAAPALKSANIIQGAIGAGVSNLGRATVLKKVANISGRVITQSVKNKVVAGVLAVSVIGGGIATGYTYLKNKNNVTQNKPNEVVVLNEDTEKADSDVVNANKKEELTEEELLEVYKDVIQSGQYHYYAFVDIDGMGVSELLVGKKMDAYFEDDKLVQMQKATLYKHTESGSEELETIGGYRWGVVLHYSEQGHNISYGTIGHGYCASTTYWLNHNGELDWIVLSENIETNQYYCGKGGMDNSEYEVTEEEYIAYNEKLGDSQAINFGEIDIKYQIQYIDNICQSIEDDLDTYKQDGRGHVFSYIDSDDMVRKIEFYPVGSSGELDYTAEFYYDVIDGEEQRVLSVLTNVITNDVYKYYERGDEIIRYVDGNKKTYDYKDGKCKVDETTVAYKIQQGFHWD